MLSFERARNKRIMRRHGDGLKYLLRRKNSLKVALTLAAAALAGATSISVTTVSGLKRNDGRVVAGARLSIAGVPGTYAVAADAVATGNPLTITLSTPLAGSAALGAALTWVTPYAEHEFEGMRGSAQQSTDERMVAAGELVRWLIYRSDAPAPAPGDDLGGLAIRSVEEMGSAGTAGYKCIVGAAS